MFWLEAHIFMLAGGSVRNKRGRRELDDNNNIITATRPASKLCVGERGGVVPKYFVGGGASHLYCVRWMQLWQNN